ncbi:MAG TPA: hypothetical protein VGZ22_30575 [Isosphaeraceae bacterium]|jgi:sugar lactone lactonase YvrE|nr:hypothetical protein [Isosphaeraceae bacterium]
MALVFWTLLATSVWAHPGSGIVVDPQGEVYFQDSLGRVVWKIDSQGKLTAFLQGKGGHWMALDREGCFANVELKLFERITPAGVKPALIFADGGAPVAVCQDGNLYYGSGFSGGDEMAPGGLSVTRMTPEGKRTLFAPGLQTTLAKLNEGVTGLAAGPEGTLYVAGPSVVLKLKMDGTVTTLAHPVVVTDCDDDIPPNSRSLYFHPPFLRGLDVTSVGTVYAAATGCRCLVRITPDGQVKTVMKAAPPWSPTGVALRNGEVFVLEYTNANEGPGEGWLPRVRKLGRDGAVTTLATISREMKERAHR